MNRINIIGIGFRPLDKKAGEALLASDVVLTNKGLLEAFRDYAEYRAVKERVIIHANVHEMIDYISNNFGSRRIAVLGVGDPMFFGIGRLIIERFGKGPVEIYPDLSSVQVAFSRIKETANNAFLISLHGGPDPEKRRKPEYEVNEVPALLKKYGKLAVLTDRENNPTKIAKELCRGEVPSPVEIKMYVCEKLGQGNERIIEGKPEEIAGQEFEHPNVVILTSSDERRPTNDE